MDPTERCRLRVERERETIELIEFWEEQRLPALEVSEYRLRLGYKDQGPRPGSKAARIAQIYNVLETKSVDWASICHTAGDIGTSRCDAFLLELNPIERSVFYSIRDRFDPSPWATHGFQRTARADLLKEAVSTFGPQLVVMYGWTGGRYWDRISGLNLRSLRTGPRHDVAVSRSAGTTYVALPCPSSLWMPNESLEYAIGSISATLAHLQ